VLRTLTEPARCERLALPAVAGFADQRTALAFA
jgi:hypothetical protein